VRAPPLCAPSHRTVATCGIHSSARAARCGRARVVALGATGRARACLGAGVTWTSRTAKAEWAGRAFHTSGIDAAGAIYVIGGYKNGGPDTIFHDVWASTDGGARPDSVKGWSWGTQWGLLRGSTRGTKRVLRGYYGVA
jgi:hypothetical protein